MKTNEQIFRIAITGPESTGKTTLAKQLADRFGGLYLPEYARSFVEKLPTHYTFEDVETIAKAQLDQYLFTENHSGNIFIFDTWLIITKVWFKWVFKKIPDWLDEQIRNKRMDLFLLCRPDLPWESDPVRENGGENRLKLYEEYRQELLNYGFNFVEISGTDELRISNAEAAIIKFCNLS